MTTRRRSKEKIYLAYRKSKKEVSCDFCSFHPNDVQVEHQTKHFWVVKNIFGYDIWDNLDVKKHLMVVPKKHRDSLQHFTAAELKEYSALLAQYDAKGYSTYTRASQNISKSIPHQHTHLLKLGPDRKDFYVFLRKPYLLWYR